MKRKEGKRTWLSRWRQVLAQVEMRQAQKREPERASYFILELTARCNQDCRYCYNVWKAREGMVQREMTTEEWCTLIGRLQDEMGCRQVTFSGGEPLLREDFREILAFCHRRGLESIVISNGRYLDQEMLEFCLAHGVKMFEVTLLGSNAATHDGLTRVPGSWERALSAMTRLYKAGATWCGVFVATSENIGQVRETVEMMIALGAKVIMFNRFNPGGEGARHRDLMPAPDDVQKALRVVDELAVAYNFPATASVPVMPCLVDLHGFQRVQFGFCAAGRAGSYPTIGPDGRVRPCNHSATILGDFHQQSMQEMLEGPALRAFTAVVPEVCRPCPGLDQCRAGCRAAAEVCFGSLEEPEPWLKANLERLPPMV